MKTLLLAGWLLVVQPAPLQSVCLQQRDVPRGMLQSVSRSITMDHAAHTVHVPSCVLSKQLGWIAGYETQYQGPRATELFAVWDRVQQFRSAQGAERYDLVNAASLRGARWFGAPLTPLPGVHVGEKAAAFSVRFRFHGRSHTDIFILLHRGRFQAAISVESPAGTFTTAQVVALARTIDARLKTRSRS